VIPLRLHRLRGHGSKLLALLIAVILWAVVHGQGVGSLSMDVPLQVQGLPEDMVIVNDPPDHVRVTIGGLQARLNALKPQDVHVPLDASDLNEPGEVERVLNLNDIRLPAGLTVLKLQPDRLKLQVDRVVHHRIAVRPRLELPEGWRVEQLEVSPAEVELAGPEIWLDALSEVETVAVRPELKPGPFAVSAAVASPACKAIRLISPDARVAIRGVLVRTASEPKGG